MNRSESESASAYRFNRSQKLSPHPFMPIVFMGCNKGHLCNLVPMYSVEPPRGDPFSLIYIYMHAWPIGFPYIYAHTRKHTSEMLRRLFHHPSQE